MTTPDGEIAGPDDRFWEQFEEVRRQHPSAQLKVAVGALRAGQRLPPRYVYERGTVLVPDVHSARVRHYLHRETDQPPRGLSRHLAPSGIPGVSMLTVDDDPAQQERVDTPNKVQEAVAWLNARCTENEPVDFPRVAAPNHLFSIAPVTLCPADEPRLPTHNRVWPPAVGGAGGAGRGVMIIDTGLVPDHVHPASVEGELRNPIQTAEPFTGTIRQYAGHGTFVTGVLLSTAPGARVWVSNALRYAGSMDERAFIPTILSELDEYEEKYGEWPHVISLSAGATSHGGQPPLGLRALLDALDAHPRTMLVAAAGNDGFENEPFWPASSASDHDGVISVGALRNDQQDVACFSNYGDSVTVFAIGERMVNAFLEGRYIYRHRREPECRYHPPGDLLHYHGCSCVEPIPEGSVQFSGWARWSGTSFATPLVAGMIATEMTTIGTTDARAAARELLRRARPVGDLQVPSLLVDPDVG